MTKSEKIITLAKYYCLELLKQESSTLQSIGDGLLSGIEFLVGKEFQDIENCKNNVLKFALENLKIRTANYSKEGHLKIIEAEKQKFVDYINKIDVDNIDKIEPLPFRRRLNEYESKEVRENLSKNWNFDGGYWEPLNQCSPKPFFFFDIENLETIDYENVKNILLQKTIRIYEINEDRIDYEIDSVEFDPKSCEVIYVDKSYNWIIYISHEGTIAFGGLDFISDIDKLLENKIHLKNKW